MGFHVKLGAPPSRTGRRRSSPSKKAVPTPPSSSTATTAWARASSAHPSSCQRSRAGDGRQGTHPSPGLAHHVLLHGQGPRQRGVAYTPRRAGRSPRSPARAQARSRATPRRPTTAQASGSFLHTGPMAASEHHGFTRTRPNSVRRDPKWRRPRLFPAGRHATNRIWRLRVRCRKAAGRT